MSDEGWETSAAPAQSDAGWETSAPVKAAASDDAGWETASVPEDNFAVKSIKDAWNATTPSNAIPGAVEAFAGGVGSLANAAVSGIAGPIKSAFTGKSAAEEIGNVSEAIRKNVPYEPQSAAGKAYLDLASIPVTAIQKGGDWVFDKTGSPLAATAAITAGNAAMLLAGGRKAAKPGEVPRVDPRFENLDAMDKQDVPPPAPPVPKEPEQMELPLTNSVEQVADKQSEQNGQLGLFDSPQNSVSTEPANVTPPIEPQVALRRAQDAEDAGKAQEAQFWKQRAMDMVQQQRDLLALKGQDPLVGNREGNVSDPATMEGLRQSTEGVSYENVPPDGVIPRDSGNNGPGMSQEVTVPKGNIWLPDENGIPVRQGMPEEPAAPPVQIASSDTPHANDMGNAIQEANGPKLGADQTYGNGEGTAPFYVPKGQRGGAGIINDMATGLQKSFEAARDAYDKISLSPRTSAADYLRNNIPGFQKSLDDRITPPPKLADTVAKATAPGVKDIPRQGFVSRNIQSGLQQMSTKFKDNPVLLAGGRILDNWHTKTELQVRELVNPVTRAMRSLSSSERVDLTQLFKREMMNDKRYTPEQLVQAGFGKKQVAAYDMMRAQHDAIIQKLNDGRTAFGKEPVTKQNAYMAALRHGDWSFSVLDKEGKPAWYVKSNTKAEALAAIDHIKTNFGDKLNMDKVEPSYRKGSDTYHPDTPRDVMGAYQDMLKHFTDDPKLSDSIRESMQAFAEGKAYDLGGHSNRFLDKSTAQIRGFEGDKPWLSKSENANALLRAQETYAKNAVSWNHAQDAMGSLKEMLSNKDLLDKQPNAVHMVQQVVNNQFGMNRSTFNAAEQTLAQLLPGYSHGKIAMGRSTSSLYKASSGIKSALYATLLGLNPTHAIASVINPFMMMPANHSYLSGRGFKHNVLATTGKAILDFAGGMMQHLSHEFTGKEIPAPMTAVGRRALKWGEDNGAFSKNTQDESASIGSSRIMSGIKAVSNTTIGLPEKIARLSTFMSFVHHLTADGKLPEMEAFQKAKDFTNNTSTGFGKQDRPMIVDKGGAAGSLAYTFRSYLFNYFNQLSTHARVMAEGNPMPLVYNLGMLGVIGGALSIPLVNEADGLWNVAKGWIAKYSPENYHYVEGRGLKEQIIAHLPDWASFGVASAATGLALQNKLGIDVANPEHPGSGIFPMAQDIREAVAGVGAVGHPNSTTLTEAAYAQAPKLIQGQMEKNMKVFHGVQQKGGETAINPNDLSSRKAIDHLRTPQDWNLRGMGMTSLAEAKDRTTGYYNSAEKGRISDATDNVGKNLYEAVMGRHNMEDARSEVKNYLQLNPDGNALKKDFNDRLMKEVLTPSQRDLARAKTYREINDVLRLRGTRGR